MKEKHKGAGIIMGIILAFGFPAIGYMFGGWKWAIAVFIVFQALIGLAKVLDNEKS